MAEPQPSKLVMRVRFPSPAQRRSAALQRQAQEVELLLLAHDHVLEEVLERLAARLLPGVRDDRVQGGHDIVLPLDEAGECPRRPGRASPRPAASSRAGTWTAGSGRRPACAGPRSRPSVHGPARAPRQACPADYPALSSQNTR